MVRKAQNVRSQQSCRNRVLNPADDGTRGSKLKEFKRESRWFSSKMTQQIGLRQTSQINLWQLQWLLQKQTSHSLIPKGFQL